MNKNLQLSYRLQWCILQYQWLSSIPINTLLNRNVYGASVHPVSYFRLMNPFDVFQRKFQLFSYIFESETIGNTYRTKYHMQWHWYIEVKRIIIQKTCQKEHQHQF